MRFVHLAVRARQWLLSQARDDRGAVPVEYIAVFAFVSIGLAIAVVKLGPSLLTAWTASQKVLLANKP
jgi:Flp pilus assembly pilin Flp